MDIKFTEVKYSTCEHNNVKKLYYSAFPPIERLPLWFLLWRSKDKNIMFYNIFDKELWIGFIYLIKYKDIIFVFYFAIDSNIRSKGYGGRILNKIKNEYPGNRIILYIEAIEKNADNIEQRIRRKQFYIENGFKDSGYILKLKSGKYELLIYGNKIVEEEFYKLIKYFSGFMLNVFIKLKLTKTF